MPGRRLRDQFLSREDLGESPLWPSLTIVSAAALYATLPGRFILGPSAGVFSAARWAVPGLTVVLLAVLLVSVPGGRIVRALGWHAQRVHVGRRVASLAITGLLTIANAVSIVLLVHVLINGGRVVPAPLLRASIHLWCVNVLVFGLWFWQLDGGGPLERAHKPVHERDFLFPQHAAPELFPVPWRATFVDYLYLSFTNASAFSPTDTMPLSRWAKVLMLLESAISLTLAIMAVARAVNILR